MKTERSTSNESEIDIYAIPDKRKVTVDRFIEDSIELPIPENIDDLLARERTQIREEYGGKIPQENLLLIRRILGTKNVSRFADVSYILLFLSSVGLAKQIHNKQAEVATNPEKLEDSINNYSKVAAVFYNKGGSATSVLRGLENEGRLAQVTVLKGLKEDRDGIILDVRGRHVEWLLQKFERNLYRMGEIEHTAIRSMSEPEVATQYIHNLREVAINAFRHAPEAKKAA